MCYRKMRNLSFKFLESAFLISILLMTRRIMFTLLFIAIVAIHFPCNGQSEGNEIIVRDYDLNIHFFLYPPKNLDSIEYLLYTPENATTACYFKPDESNNCSFYPDYETKVLIHGYAVQLLTGNFLEQLKDTLLKNNNFNVIVANWTTLNGGEYPAAVMNSIFVGKEIGKMINYLVLSRGVNASDVHIIGHSLGAHVAGVAGRQVPNLGRITGLDPAGPLFSGRTGLMKSLRLSNTSAKLVDVIHTSADLGISEPIGTIDFYPNGGKEQPACQIGNQFFNADAIVKEITEEKHVEPCRHNIVLAYFMNSIELCNFIGVYCADYEMYSEGSCDSVSSIKRNMGYFGVEGPESAAASTFYLNTTANAPYCETQ